jgi:hypothetical protein
MKPTLTGRDLRKGDLITIDNADAPDHIKNRMFRVVNEMTAGDIELERLTFKDSEAIKAANRSVKQYFKDRK